MKRKVEIEIEVPEFIDDNFLSMLALLTNNELMQIKGIVFGILLGSDRCTPEELASFSLK